FRLRNLKQLELKNNFAIAPIINFVIIEDLQGFFRTRSGFFESISEKFNGAEFLVTFSRVGFNASKNQALIHVSKRQSLSLYVGHFYLLSKKKGKWFVKREMMSGIS